MKIQRNFQMLGASAALSLTLIVPASAQIAQRNVYRDTPAATAVNASSTDEFAKLCASPTTQREAANGQNVLASKDLQGHNVMSKDFQGHNVQSKDFQGHNVK